MQKISRWFYLLLFLLSSVCAVSNAYSTSPMIPSQVQSCFSFAEGVASLSRENETALTSALEFAARGGATMVRVSVWSPGANSREESQIYRPTPEIMELTLARTRALQARLEPFVLENRTAWSFQANPGWFPGYEACEAYIVVFFRRAEPVCTRSGPCVVQCSALGC